MTVWLPKITKLGAHVVPFLRVSLLFDEGFVVLKHQTNFSQLFVPIRSQAAFLDRFPLTGDPLTGTMFLVVVLGHHQ